MNPANAVNHLADFYLLDFLTLPVLIKIDEKKQKKIH